MTWHQSTDAAELWHAVGPWCSEHPVENAPLLAEVGHLLATGPNPDGLAAGWWTGVDGTVDGAYLRAPRHNPLLTRMPREALAELTSVLPRPDALGVPEVVADDVLRAWAAAGLRRGPSRCTCSTDLRQHPPAPVVRASRVRTTEPSCTGGSTS